MLNALWKGKVTCHWLDWRTLGTEATEKSETWWVEWQSPPTKEKKTYKNWINLFADVDLYMSALKLWREGWGRQQKKNGLPCCWLGRGDVRKMAILLKTVYSVMQSPSRSSQNWRSDIEFPPRGSTGDIKVILSKMNSIPGTTTPDFKRYYTTLQQQQSWHRNRGRN